jgi:hypothetical protein
VPSPVVRSAPVAASTVVAAAPPTMAAATMATETTAWVGVEAEDERKLPRKEFLPHKEVVTRYLEIAEDVDALVVRMMAAGLRKSAKLLLEASEHIPS